MVKVCGVPAHPSNDGVTVTVAVTGEVPVLVAVKEGIFPVPVAPSPILVLLFDQENNVVPPVRSVVKFTAVVAAPLHKTWSDGSST